MRIDRLDLLAFGPFTDVTLDLAERPIHVVYGPNEAGKSTARRALEALLFGVPATTGDAHHHPMPALRVGGVLRPATGPALTLVRRKGTRHTLSDERGELVADEELGRLLGGVGRQAFGRMFSLSHASLREGAEAMLHEGGELGASLFDAGLGAGRLREVRQALEAEAEDLYKPTGAKPLVNRMLREYAERRQESRDAGLAARDFTELHDRLQALRAGRRHVETEVRGHVERLSALRRLAEVRPLAVRRRAAERALLELADAPALADTAVQDRRDALRDLAGAERAAAAARREAERLANDVAANVVDDALADAAAPVDALHARVGAFRAALAEAPRVRADLARLEAQVERLRRESYPGVAVEELEALRPHRGRWAAVDSLARERAGVDAALAAARRDLAGTQRDLAEARGRRDAAGARPDVGPLRAAAAAAQALGDVEATLAGLAAEVAAIDAALAMDLAALPLVSDPEALGRLTVPVGETVARFAQEMERLAEEGRELRVRRSAALERAREVDARLETLRAAGAILSEADLDAARRRREASWRQIREAWAGAGAGRVLGIGDDLADRYEADVAAADAAADGLRRNAGRAAQIAQLETQGRRAAIELAELDRAAADHERRERELAAAWRAAWAAADLDPLPPAEMAAWLDRRTQLLARAEELRARRARLDGERRREALRRAALAAALGQAGVAAGAGEPLSALLDRATATLAAHDDAVRAARALREEIETLEGREADAADAVEAAARAAARWGEAWTEAVTRVGLHGGVSPAEAVATRSAAAELFAALDAAAALRRRRDELGAGVDAFGRDAADLVGRLAPDLVALPPDEAVTALAERRRTAIAAGATAAELRRQLADQRTAAQAHEATIADARRRLDALLAAAGCDRLEALEEAERRSTRRLTLLGELADVDAQLAEAGVAPGAPVIETAGAADPDALAADLDAADARRREAEARRETTIAEIARTETLLAQMDGAPRAAAAAEDAERSLAAIRRGAERYATLRLALALLEREVDRYRRAHAGPVLQRADSLFRRLTEGSFAGLTTGYDERGRPVLLGRRADRREVPVAGLSEGARDSLYLALRLATLHEHARTGEPLPLVLDDVLLTLDDRRAAAALHELDRLAGPTQVLLFTHHAHVVELAEAVIPRRRRRIHDLAALRDGRVAAAAAAPVEPPAARRDDDLAGLQLELT